MRRPLSGNIIVYTREITQRLTTPTAITTTATQNTLSGM